MLLVLLILLPIIAGIFSFIAKGASAKYIAFVSSIISMGIAAALACDAIQLNEPTYQIPWLPSMGAHISFVGSKLGLLMALLTAMVSLLIALAQPLSKLERSHAFFGFLQLAQAGLMGVFLANDLLLFYFFWELALIPVYFLCSQWGTEKSIKVTFKFFIYTFLGSLIMLAGILFLYFNTPHRSFAYQDIVATGQQLSACSQQVLFAAFFIAFAIKMPIFPFHTWQPDTYDHSHTSVTIVLSAVMVKMGLFATMKWVMPVFPQGVDFFKDIVIVLALIGLVYSSIIAMVQTNMKRLIAYSSIAHIALMVVALFSLNEIGSNAVVVQMFNHGINIAGMWLILGMVEQRFGTKDIKALGGLATVAPYMTIALVIIAFANIALPLTNGFIGEFMLFHGIFQSDNPNHIVYMVIGGLGVVLGAIYTLNLVQKIAYGPVVKEQVKDLNSGEAIALFIVISCIIAVGVYPTIIYQFL